MKFSDLVGHKDIAQNLKNMVDNDRIPHEYTKALAEQNGCSILSQSSDIYTDVKKNNIRNYPPELLTVQTFYEKFFLAQELKITYLAFQLPAGLEHFKEPEWDKEYWRAEEEKGRTKRNIR